MCWHSRVAIAFVPGVVENPLVRLPESYLCEIAMDSTHIANLEPGNRIQLPAEWAKALGIRGAVRLERTSDAILIRPAKATWDDIFATKLSVRPGDPTAEADVTELSGDDFLF